MYEHLIEFYNKKKYSIENFFNDSPEAKEIRQITSFLDNSGLYSKICYPQRMWHIINNKLELKNVKSVINHYFGAKVKDIIQKLVTVKNVNLNMLLRMLLDKNVFKQI